jgi:hypothetical protein
MGRFLVVANQTLGGRYLTERIRQSMAAGPARFHVVVPATPVQDNLTWTEGEAQAIAQERLGRGAGPVPGARSGSGWGGG